MKKLIGNCSMIVLGLILHFIPQKGSCGGPVIISGLDTEYGIRPGNTSHGTIAMWASVINTGILSNVTSCGILVNTSGNILVIGGGKGPFASDQMTNFWTQIGTALGRGITFVNGAANITSQSFSGFSMISVCNTIDGTGKLTSAEYVAVCARQNDIASFVNCGGGLFASSCTLTPAYGYISIGSPSLLSINNNASNSTPTSLGTSMGIPAIAGPYHNYFTQWPTFLSVLSNLPATPPSTSLRAAILGGKDVTLPPTWVTSIPDSCFCCNNNTYRLPASPAINGPAVLSCDTATAFSTLRCPGASYTWSVSPSVSFTGQGTSSISIIGPYSPFVTSYTIAVTIRCGDRSVSKSIAVTPGQCNANPGILNINGNASGMTFTGVSNCSHWWFLVKDDDRNREYTTGETYNTTAITTSTASFSPLITGQSYVVYHYVYCTCGRYCSKWAWTKFDFTYYPAQQMRLPAPEITNPKPVFLNEKTVYKEVPKEFLKSLPKELGGQKIVQGYIVERPNNNNLDLKAKEEVIEIKEKVKGVINQ